MGLKICPFSLFLFMASATTFVMYQKLKDDDSSSSSSKSKKINSSSSSSSGATKEKAETEEAVSDNFYDHPVFQVVFVVGGPGSGKGTQCRLLEQYYSKTNSPWKHLSAGDLLRAERQKKDSKLAKTINNYISKGALVPDEITVGLLYSAMKEAYINSSKTENSKDGETSGIVTTRFLVDGFPRSQGNVKAWNEQLQSKEKDKVEVKFMLFLNCPEDCMTSRLLERAKSEGRADDQNLDVIRNRFQINQKETMPIIAFYKSQDMVREVQADQSIEDVHAQIKKLFEE